MPYLKYTCHTCGNEYEALYRYSDPGRINPCPKCESSDTGLVFDYWSDETEQDCSYQGY